MRRARQSGWRQTLGTSSRQARDVKSSASFYSEGWELLLYHNIGGQICWLHILIVTSSLVLVTRAGRRGRSLPWLPLLVILSMAGRMFCPQKEQLRRHTAATHSVSRWTNQSAFRLSPSISENNLGDIIKVPFCHSRGQRALLFLTLLQLPSWNSGSRTNGLIVASVGDICLFLSLSRNTDFGILTPIQSDSVTHSRVLPNSPLSLPH